MKLDETHWSPLFAILTFHYLIHNTDSHFNGGFENDKCHTELYFRNALLLEKLSLLKTEAIWRKICKYLKAKYFWGN